MELSCNNKSIATERTEVTEILRGLLNTNECVAPLVIKLTLVASFFY